jgi:hypothetical protein
MRFILSLPILAAILTTPLAATTLADLSPTALPGKTLVLTFEGGDSATPLTGTWIATFAKTPAKSVTIRDFPGQSGSSASNWTYNGSPFPDSHGYSLTSTAAFGNKPAEITLWISVSGIRFYLTIDGASNFGGAVFESREVPDIAIQQPAKSNLVDGKSKKSFGTLKVGKKGAAKTFTIVNTGTAKLTGLAVSLKGKQKGSFIAGNPRKKSLAPGASTTFEVSFKPTAKGTRKATIQVSSNDEDEDPFDIEISGEGAPK